MTLLQDFRCLGIGGQRGSDGSAHPMLTALSTASPKHQTLAEGEKQDVSDREVCVEEDSGYQTSENEREEENENACDTLDSYQRRLDHCYTGKGVEILDLSRDKDGVAVEDGESGLRDAAKNGTEQTWDAVYDRKGHYRQVNSEHEESKRRLAGYLVSDEGEGTSNSEHEKRKRKLAGYLESDECEGTSNSEHGKRKRKLTGYFDSDESEGTSNSEHETRKRRLAEYPDSEESAGTSNSEHEKRKRKLAGYLDSDESEGTSNSEHGKRKRRRTKSSDNVSILSTDEEEEKADTQIEAALENPLAATSIHSGLRCCTNGFFRVTGRTVSNFESNCECTTHSLVDWRTRVTWSNSNLQHQIKVREVTVLSPFRNSAILWGLPYFMRICPPSQPRIPPQQIHQPLEVPESPTRIPQQPLKVKKEQVEERKPAEGERGYRCVQVGCGRSFCRNEELTRHLRIHSGQRPFVCQRCGRRFVRRDHLTKHQRTHLPAHVKRSYTCPLPACTHRYTRSDALTRHMWTAHHVRARQPSRAGVTDQPRHHHHHHHQSRRTKLGS